MTELTETPDTPSLSALTDRLKASLIENPDPAMLSQQAALLDQIFTTIVEQKVSKAFSGERHYAHEAKEWLAFALKAQKQSADALKTRATMEYIDHGYWPPRWPLRNQW